MWRHCRVHDIDEQRCCTCGEAWSSRWLMTQLTNGQHPCVLVFVPMVDILNIPCDCQFVFSVLDELYVSHTTLDPVGNILRVHCKSMNCDVSFSQGNIRTLFGLGEHVFMYVYKCSFCLEQCTNYKNQTSFSRVMITNVVSRFLWITVYCRLI